jgi:anti-sigma regulatory factor (Ser/Thr protein kinase)
VLILTAYGNYRFAKEALNLGAIYFLEKPYEIEELEYVIQHKLYPWKFGDNVSIKIFEFVEYDERIFNIPSDLKYSHFVSSYIIERAVNIGVIDRSEMNKVGMAIYEAISNAVIHGNLEIPSILKDQSLTKFNEYLKERIRSPKWYNKKVKIISRITKKELFVSVEDEGKGFDVKKVFEEIQTPRIDLAYGRGILIMLNFMDIVQFNEKGNKVTMIKKNKKQNLKGEKL